LNHIAFGERTLPDTRLDLEAGADDEDMRDAIAEHPRQAA
jgi:hypothetical protein